jgi:phospholipid/cholesterol/gamma-HCH transport system ATP-binding protein
LKLMIGLLMPDQGTVRVHNRSLGGLDEDGLSQVRRQMGFLFQSAALFDSFTLEDKLMLPLQRFTAKPKAELDARIQKVLDQVGLGGDRHKMPSELSGGMRKRAGLARALVLEPSILLVDEPSSGLDRVSASEIDELLLSIKNEGKTTMVIVTHDIRGARRVGDRLAVLDRGKVAAIGTAAEVEANDNPLVRALVSGVDR